MVGRDGGKAKPLKQPKKAEKVVLDEDVEFKKKMVRFWSPSKSVLFFKAEEKKKMAAAAKALAKK